MQRRLQPDTRCSLFSHKSAVWHRLSGDDDQPQSLLFFGSILTAFIPPDGPRWLMIVIALQFGVLGVILNDIAALFFSQPARHSRLSKLKLRHIRDFRSAILRSRRADCLGYR